MTQHQAPDFRSRTPYRLELKFTTEEWEALRELSEAEGTSRYNYAKRAALGNSQPFKHRPRPPEEAERQRLCRDLARIAL